MPGSRLTQRRVLCLTDCQRSTWITLLWHGGAVNQKPGKCGHSFQTLKCIHPLTSNPISKILFFRCTCTEMSVQGNLLQQNIGNKLKVHQQKTCKKKHSKSVVGVYAAFGTHKAVLPTHMAVPRAQGLVEGGGLQSGVRAVLCACVCTGPRCRKYNTPLTMLPLQKN